MKVRIRKHNGGGQEVYHTDECRNYPENGRDIDRDDADARGFEHCRFCSGEYEPAQADSRKYQRLIKEARADD